jgi:hypothetical protein
MHAFRDNETGNDNQTTRTENRFDGFAVESVYDCIEPDNGSKYNRIITNPGNNSGNNLENIYKSGSVEDYTGGIIAMSEIFGTQLSHTYKAQTLSKSGQISHQGEECRQGNENGVFELWSVSDFPHEL